ncbi:MAG: hypothetical protein JXB39_04510, partial [Deltaproteobacteria bacterium]|nr:hypothetical protein [Deltaproteobacteria bacterium]
MTFLRRLGALLDRERRFAGLRVVVIAAIVMAAARGYREPHPYPISHWLLDWRHGLVKRGFVGTLVSPLYAWKAPSEVGDVVTTLSLLVLVAALVALAVGALRLARSATRPPDEAMLGGAALVLASSPLPVSMAYTAGFFDRFLELATLGAVAALARRRFATIPILVCAGVLVHELFLLYGLPVLLFAVLVSSVKPGEPVD